MEITKDLLEYIKNKEIKITPKFFNGISMYTFDGKVIGFFSLGTDFFIEYEDGRLINTRYIESIRVIK